MSLLGNPVPTSGEIRTLRRRVGQHRPSRALTTDPPEVVPDAADDGDAIENVSDELVRFIPNPPQRMQQALTEPRVRRLLHAVVAAGTAGLDTLEQVSDETHDTVEENLARLTEWPRAMFESVRPPAPLS